ncbi:hypothetical protein chiPu_0018796 [Chiloscyllium punctatum]|uniref:Uncharacterized protein n=1 Tax=Chiloscyllium punctatum TaxID=137246 RepID=A0A401RPR3_CHIPU|nr:hypothetical protein [Chiloscyllium punctatum]
MRPSREAEPASRMRARTGQPRRQQQPASTSSSNRQPDTRVASTNRTFIGTALQIRIARVNGRFHISIIANIGNACSNALKAHGSRGRNKILVT